MRIKLYVDASPHLSWQRGLAVRLGAAGHSVVTVAAAGASRWPSAVELLLSLEGLLHGRPQPPKTPSPAAAVDPTAFDLLIDLSGGPVGVPGALRLLYDGAADPAAAVAALLDRRVPHLAVERDGVLIETGQPAVERPQWLSHGLANVFARGADLCLRAVTRLARGGEAAPHGARGVAASLGAAAVGRFAGAGLAIRAQSALRRLLHGAPTWRTGLRRVSGPGLLAGGLPPAKDYRWLPDDGRRFYADPFILDHAGRRWLFVEEFPYATGTGVISVAEIGPDGSTSAPRPVLETGSHLSYPYVFADDDGVWMIPETSAARTVELFRAVDFPWVWARERVLIEGIQAGDATPFRHDGRLWLFATTTESGGSTWDALSLFHGALSGTFAPHPLNPVLVDAGAARPAGRMVVQDGVVLRPAQDCRTGYGAGLALCAVERLDLEGYSQKVLARIEAPAAWRAGGLHTVNVAAGFEAIDCFSRRTPPGA